MFEEAWYVGHGGWRCNVWRATEHVWPISRRIWQRRWCLAGRQTGWWWWHLAMRHQQWRVRTQHAVDKRVTHPTTNRAMRFDLALKNRRCCQLSLLKGNASNLWSEVSMLNDCYCNDYLTQKAEIVCTCLNTMLPVQDVCAIIAIIIENKLARPWMESECSSTDCAHISTYIFTFCS